MRNSLEQDRKTKKEKWKQDEASPYHWCMVMQYVQA